MRWPVFGPVSSAGLLSVALASCSLPQSDECRAYVACQKAYDAATKDVSHDVDVEPFEPGGTCWAAPRAAAQCTEQCRVALDALADVPDAPKECTTE